MNQNEILVNMARYIHAVYDVNVNINDPNLNVILKKYVEKLGAKDEVLQSYWKGYVAVLSGKVVTQKDIGSSTTQASQTEQTIEEKPKKEGMIYRGQKI